MFWSRWISFVAERLPELWLRVGEHLMLTGLSTGAAILIGVPLGICAARIRWLRGGLTGAVGILQTIPSLAMLVILLALLHRIGTMPAIIALTLYALLPIVRNTLAGLEGVAPEVVEAARGIGMDARQRLWLVEIPIAMPVIVAGIRTAAVVGVGIATLSAFIGAGGLGQFINRGLALSNTDLILLGAVPAALLALIVDGAIAAAQWGLRYRPTGASRRRVVVRRFLRPLALATPALLIAVGCAAYFSARADSSGTSRKPAGGDDHTIRIGTKNFTEQLIVGELMAQLIEAHTDLQVERRFNLGGTMICHGALENGEIDLYAEYTGTALTAILERSVIADPDRAWRVVDREYRRRFAADWLPPFGFDNTYAITVREADAASLDLRTISDLAAVSETLRAGFTAEFSERPDGYPGLRRAYGLEFDEVRDLDPALMVQAIANREVDVICAFATDGRIAAYDLKPLRDDRGFFPPYQAAPVVRLEVLQAHPVLRKVLALPAGRLDDAGMQRLNYEVDGNGRSPRAVAREFLEDRAWLKEETAGSSP
ncbi:MAG: ABC transporter permease subunit [Candidatus Eisenbacteria bacterium]|nr:ABC transporter permease subunit [Candidatus Latescibacterota bacterium]MBD3301288.1 ABC transporter permease subunit [Candidatus Eisenbacteria bacterium]